MKVFIILLLLISNLHAASPQAKIEQKAIKYYINGNYSKYFSQIRKLNDKYPESPDALFYLLTLKIDKNIIPDFEDIFPYYEKMIENENIDFFTRQIMLSELADYYINKNKFDRANELIQKNCYIDDWKYTEIFNYSYYNDLEHDFSQIEKNIVSHPDNKIKWTILPYKTSHGWVPLEFLAEDKFGTIYTTTYFYLPKDMTIILWLTSEASVKTFVDGKMLFVNDAAQYNYYLNNIFKITLKQGWHNLLVKSVKIHNSFDFKCRLINEKGKPVNGLKFSLTRQVVKPNNNISNSI